jgi:hypothetical protein
MEASFPILVFGDALFEVVGLSDVVGAVDALEHVDVEESATVIVSGGCV